MAKRMLRTDGEKAEIWLRCTKLDETESERTAKGLLTSDSKYEYRSLNHPAQFEDDADSTLLYDGVGAYGDSGRRLTNGGGATDDELGAGVPEDGSMLSLMNKAVAEADSRESVIGGERIPWIDFRLYLEWLSDTTYTASIRTFSYGLKRNDPEDGACYELLDGAHGEWDNGYILDAGDLGADGTPGQVAWFIKTRVLDVIKAAEGI